MKNVLFGTVLLAFICACSSGKTIFELSPEQSMLMTGKGEGQDAARNPFSNQKSIAIVKNLGDAPLSVRIQNNKKLLGIVDLKAAASKEFILNVGDELYLDSKQATKASVKFKKFD